MRLGFVIDHESCIGCHACTVACKAENDVPIGDFRTWVKYVDRGTFPNVRRHFLVQRCNHCTDAPCVTICPVNALEKRADGIVDIDREACIGCRACMQACPYDALYLNEDRGSVEKCHYCAHRIEKGLEPACVNVCPVDAIISGDLDEPDSRIARLVETRPTRVRRPEQQTGPNVHYLGADDVALNPGSASRPPLYMWSDCPPGKPEPWPPALATVPHATVVHDAGHRVEWGWPVALYLVTKGIAAGAALIAPFAGTLGLSAPDAAYAPELIALVFALITCLLLTGDLTRPWAAYRMLTRPNWRSWLVRGAVILSVFVALTAAGMVLRFAGAAATADALRWANAIVALAVAGYTALLFGQCKGRDLWESKVLPVHLLVQAALCGCAVLLPLADSSGAWGLRSALAVCVVAHLLLAIAERFGRHPTENARQAAACLGEVRSGPARAYRDGLLIGVGATLILVVLLPAVAFVPALIGLYLYEHAYVRAAQLPPLS